MATELSAWIQTSVHLILLVIHFLTPLLTPTIGYDLPCPIARMISIILMRVRLASAGIFQSQFHAVVARQSVQQAYVGWLVGKLNRLMATILLAYPHW